MAAGESRVSPESPWARVECWRRAGVFGPYRELRDKVILLRSQTVGHLSRDARLEAVQMDGIDFDYPKGCVRPRIIELRPKMIAVPSSVWRQN